MSKGKRVFFFFFGITQLMDIAGDGNGDALHEYSGGF